MMHFLLECLFAFAIVCTFVCYCAVVAGDRQSRRDDGDLPLTDRWTERDR